MPVMRNFRKIMEKTRASYGLPASGPGANELPRVLRAPRVEHKAGQGQSKGDAGSGRNRAGVRKTGCTAPTPWPSQENSADNRETATAGCFE